MAGPPAKTTQAECAARDAVDQPCQTTAAINAVRVSTLHDEFIAIVQALAKRHAREDYAAELAALNASQSAIKVDP